MRLLTLKARQRFGLQPLQLAGDAEPGVLVDAIEAGGDRLALQLQLGLDLLLALAGLIQVLITPGLRLGADIGLLALHILIDLTGLLTGELLHRGWLLGDIGL